MKSLYSSTFFLLSISLALLLSNPVFAQGEIITVNPPSAFVGETMHLIIQGDGTNFIEGKTDIEFVSCQVKVNSILVSNSTILTVSVNIDKDAQAGFCKFIVTSGFEEYTGEFEIIKLQQEVEATITIFPVQSIYVADYDLTNLRNLPLLFNIIVYTAGHEQLKVVGELSHEKYGMLAIADKQMNDLGSIVSFDNREFDSYDLTETSDELIEAIPGNGTLPPGIYECNLFVYGKNNELVAKTETAFYLPEPTSAIDLVGPGTSVGSSPDILYSGTPYFEWFCNSDRYDFSLYEVRKDQFSAEDITNNLPVFEMKDIVGNSFLYPNYAEQLKVGRTYAWQIVTKIPTSAGLNEIYSEVFWFNFDKINDFELNNEIISINIEPDDIDLFPGDSVQIIVSGFDQKGNSFPIDCELKVIPSKGGTLNNNGWFVAGKITTTIAVMASCKDKEDYITINIVGN